ncbi:GPP34 family phosphoprotein [Streptomyces sp. SID7958]|uniref:GPP34 family phosphoprotein n=2 Tax=unclassified Streptomyces TaxID=2593676 RepID=A0A6G3QZH7_9ACTN|nr:MULTISPECIES: GPP34 family phosphoprotein [unclassified Streptomyces]NEA88614.1 GPP34 family phosphoprotein [Streptomyces sp. SID14436]NEC79908.1 GPP34 family phosphoprotein [Streptomyces sp. SID7958]
MSTPKDLLIVALQDGGPVTQGELSLGLAAAELIDLLRVPAARLDGGRIVPGRLPGPADPLLEEAAAAFVTDDPYEPVDDWLWRRGEGLAAAYLDVLEADGTLERRGGRPFRDGERVLTDSPARRAASDRRDAREPVLLTLAEIVGLPDGPDGRDRPQVTDYAVERVLGAAEEAVQELEAERQRRLVEQAAYDNIWRVPE